MQTLKASIEHTVHTEKQNQDDGRPLARKYEVQKTVETSVRTKRKGNDKLEFYNQLKCLPTMKTK